KLKSYVSNNSQRRRLNASPSEHFTVGPLVGTGLVPGEERDNIQGKREEGREDREERKERR
ncbi:MAG: hypothetical protein ACKPKO_38175, partial [Candidatus Fonsibacter sp.]